MAYLKSSQGGSVVSENASFPPGMVIKTYWDEKLDVQTITGGAQARVAVTGLAITGITPKNSSSEFLVTFHVSFWGNDTTFAIERDIAGAGYAMIAVPTGGSGSRILSHAGGSHRGTYELNAASMTVLDSPGTASDINYKIVCNTGGDNDGQINRANTFGTSASDEQGICTLTVQEIER